MEESDKKESAQNIFSFYENLPNAARALFDIQKKNLESFAKAQHIAFESSQEIVMRQRDVFSQIMAKTSDATNDVMSKGVAGMQPTSLPNGEALQASYSTFMNNTKEVSELVKEANKKAYSVLKKRADENIEDMKKIKIV